MDYSEIKKLFLRGFIGFLSLTALVAILSVFYQDFGTIQQRILASTFTISIASICAMSCAAFMERHSWIQLGMAGIISSVLSAILLLLGIWLVLESVIFFKIIVTLVTTSIAFAHAFLLALPELAKKHFWVQQATALTIGILAVQIIVAVWFELQIAIYYQFLAVVAIVVGLETLIIPILLKLKGSGDENSKELHLKQVSDDLYEDVAGNTYKIRAVDTVGIN